MAIYNPVSSGILDDDGDACESRSQPLVITE